MGGAEVAQNSMISARGAAPRETAIEIDGMSVNVNSAGSNLMSYPDNSLIQEVVFQTSGITAETSRGGIRVNMIPKEGGNRFSTMAYAGLTPSRFVSVNLPPELQNRGLRGGESVQHIHDVSISPGGPIVRDKLWFFTSARWLATDQLTANTFQDNGEQGVNRDDIGNAMLRLTWQASPRNKISAWYGQQWKGRDHVMSAFFDPEEAASVYLTLNILNSQVKWTSPITSRLLIEAGFSTAPTAWEVPAARHLRRGTRRGTYMPGDAMLLGGRVQTNRRSGIEVRRSETNHLEGVRRQRPGQPELHDAGCHERVVSYYHGSHAFKFGAEVEYGKSETFIHSNNASLTQNYRSGVPSTVTVRNSPSWGTGPFLEADAGFFAQDTWTIRRLTATLGVRAKASDRR